MASPIINTAKTTQNRPTVELGKSTFTSASIARDPQNEKIQIQNIEELTQDTLDALLKNQKIGDSIEFINTTFKETVDLPPGVKITFNHCTFEQNCKILSDSQELNIVSCKVKEGVILSTENPICKIQIKNTEFPLKNADELPDACNKSFFITGQASNLTLEDSSGFLTLSNLTLEDMQGKAQQIKFKTDGNEITSFDEITKSYRVITPAKYINEEILNSIHLKNVSEASSSDNIDANLQPYIISNETLEIILNTINAKLPSSQELASYEVKDNNLIITATSNGNILTESILNNIKKQLNVNKIGFDSITFDGFRINKNLNLNKPKINFFNCTIDEALDITAGDLTLKNCSISKFIQLNRNGTLNLENTEGCIYNSVRNNLTISTKSDSLLTQKKLDSIYENLIEKEINPDKLSLRLVNTKFDSGIINLLPCTSLTLIGCNLRNNTHIKLNETQQLKDIIIKNLESLTSQKLPVSLTISGNTKHLTLDKDYRKQKNPKLKIDNLYNGEHRNRIGRDTNNDLTIGKRTS